MNDIGNLLHTLVRHQNGSDIWFYSAEWIIGRFSLFCSYSIEKCRLPNIWQSDDAAAK